MVGSPDPGALKLQTRYHWLFRPQRHFDRLLYDVWAVGRAEVVVREYAFDRAIPPAQYASLEDQFVHQVSETFLFFFFFFFFVCA